MADDLKQMKAKLLAKKRPNRVAWDKGLSTGSTLLNLACTNRPDIGLVPGNFYYFVGDSSSGKAQPLDAKVLTPNGWKCMGDLIVGDEIIDPDGGTGFVENIFPQGEKEIVRVEFSDGGVTECCEEHLWLTVDRKENLKRRSKRREAVMVSGKEYRKGHPTYVKTEADVATVKTTREILQTLTYRPRNVFNHRIPVTKPVSFAASEETDLPIHPYLMGVLLGNGLFGSSRVTLSSSEVEILNRVKKILPKGCRLVPCKSRIHDYDVRGMDEGYGAINPMLDLVRHLGLYGCRAATKYIPSCYLRSTVKERISLLQGLLDTDGYAGKADTIVYSTVSPLLRDGVIELVRSLGGLTRLTEKKEPKYSYRGETGQPSHRITINLPKEITPFLLKRKAVRCKPRRSGLVRSIISVKNVGKKQCQCILVTTKRHLYITDDYIVTHNTWHCLTLLAEATLNPNYKNHRFIFDNAENGALMDIRRYFGREVESRLEPPEKTAQGEPVHSDTVESFYYHVDDAFKAGKPFIYILDSMDALTSDPEIKKFAQRKNAKRNDGDAKGSYGADKAKANSAGLRLIFNKLTKSDSIIVMISQTRDRIGFGSQFDPKTRSGGRALTFFAGLEIWTSIAGHIKTKHKGHTIEQGINSKIRIKKNRLSGRDRTVTIPIYHSLGIDDVGSCVSYLVDWKKWPRKGREDEDDPTKGIITAAEFNFAGSYEKLIAHIQENNLEEDLHSLVTKVWNDVEEACAVNRKSRYGD